MFWNHNQSPQIDTILVRQDLTLSELLNEVCVLDELQAKNLKLIEFLTRHDILEEMITLITTEPSDDVDEREQYKNPNLVCELLTADLPYFSDKIIGNETLLTKLYSFLESEPPLNPLLASFFSRTMAIFFKRNQEQNWYSYRFACHHLLEFLKNKGNCVPLLMKHLGTSAIMDLTLSLVASVADKEVTLTVLNWLDSQELIQSIIGLLDPSIDADRHSSASQLLCDIFIKSCEPDPNFEIPLESNPLLTAIKSPKTVEKLLDTILRGEKCETSIVGGVTVLLTLLEPINICGESLKLDGQLRCGNERNNEKGGSGDHIDQNCCVSPSVSSSVVEATLPYLPLLHDLLINPPKKPAVKMNFGVVDPPLGVTRLHVAKLLAALVATHNPNINSKLAELGTISVLLDLFFTYTWNNFLHTQVEKCLAFALDLEQVPSENSHSNTLFSDIFDKCQLIQRILSAWNDNEAEQERPGGCRRGYMGHLVRIANNISCHAVKEGPLQEFLKESLSEEVLSSWETFINNTLEPINEMQSTCLGGTHPSESVGQNGNGYDDNSLSNDAIDQQAFADYQSQEMTSPLVDNFGFNENEFNDSIQPTVDQLTNLPFSMSEEDELEIERQEEMFNKVCSRHINVSNFEEQRRKNYDDDSDEDDDDDDLNKQWPTFHRTSPNKELWNGGINEGANSHNSSDDEERPGPEGREEGSRMEVDLGAEAWSNSGIAEANPDPWASVPSTNSTNAEGWADFDSNFGMATSTDPEESSKNSVFEPTACSTAAVVSSVPESSDSSNCLIIGSTSTLSVVLPSDPATVSTTVLETTSPLFTSDNNANPSEDVNIDETSESQELMDNFRFLSSQGMMAVGSLNGEITVEQVGKTSGYENDEKVVDKQEIKQLDEKQQSQPELEKVVVAVSATATTTVAESTSDNRGTESSIAPSISAMDSSA